MINTPVQQQLNVNPTELKTLVCPSCGNQTFQQLYVIKKLSALQNPTGKEGLIPFNIFACSACGAVPSELGGLILANAQEQKSDTK